MNLVSAVELIINCLNWVVDVMYAKPCIHCMVINDVLLLQLLHYALHLYRELHFILLHTVMHCIKVCHKSACRQVSHVLNPEICLLSVCVLFMTQDRKGR